MWNLKKIIEMYQNKNYVYKYKEEYTRGIKFKNIRSRIIATREKTIIKKFLAKILKNNSIIIDIPCGTGKLGEVLNQFAIKILAADISLPMMILAKEEYLPNKFIGFLRCDAQKIPLKDETIDIVICLRLFQRIPKNIRINILKEFYRISKNYLIISYSYSSPFQKIRRRIRKFYDKENPIFFSLDFNNITLELKQAGFVIQDKKLVLPGLSSEVILLVQKLKNML